MFDLTIASLISLIDTLVSYSIIIGVWSFTVAVFTKPHNNTIEDHINFFFKHDMLDRNLGLIESRLLKKAIESAKWRAVDYYGFKMAHVSIYANSTTTRFVFIGCLNNWYYLGRS